MNIFDFLKSVTLNIIFFPYCLLCSLRDILKKTQNNNSELKYNLEKEISLKSYPEIKENCLNNDNNFNIEYIKLFIEKMFDDADIANYFIEIDKELLLNFIKKLFQNNEFKTNLNQFYENTKNIISKEDF